MPLCNVRTSSYHLHSARSEYPPPALVHPSTHTHVVGEDPLAPPLFLLPCCPSFSCLSRVPPSVPTLSLSLSLHMCIHMCVYIYIHTHTRTHTHTSLRPYPPLSLSLYIRVYIYVCIYIYPHAHTHTHTHTHAHTRTHTPTLAHTHTYTHTYMYIYIYHSTHLLFCLHSRRYGVAVTSRILKLQVSFAKETYKRDDILQK